MRVRALRRRARLLFLPAYGADYTFGAAFTAHGERRPQRFQAVVSGMDAGSIAAERHYSPRKVCPCARACLHAMSPCGRSLTLRQPPAVPRHAEIREAPAPARGGPLLLLTCRACTPAVVRVFPPQPLQA